MNETAILLSLAGIHFVALLSPGPDFALVVQNATRHGRQTGIYIALGLSTAILLHAFLSLTGVSYLIHQHPFFYTSIQILGGGYLLYIGIGTLRSVIKNYKKKTAPPTEIDSVVINNKRQAFIKGFTTNILNPKAWLFFISLMSSLVPVGMSFEGKVSVLFILFVITLLWFSSLAWMLSTNLMQQKIQKASIYIDGLCGIIFTIVACVILTPTIIKIITLISY